MEHQAALVYIAELEAKRADLEYKLDFATFMASKHEKRVKELEVRLEHARQLVTDGVGWGAGAKTVIDILDGKEP